MCFPLVFYNLIRPLALLLVCRLVERPLSVVPRVEFTLAVICPQGAFWELAERVQCSRLECCFCFLFTCPLV